MKVVGPSEVRFHELTLSDLARFVPQKSQIEWPVTVGVWWDRREQSEVANLTYSDKYTFALPLQGLVKGEHFEVVPDFARIVDDTGRDKYTLLSLHMVVAVENRGGRSIAGRLREI